MKLIEIDLRAQTVPSDQRVWRLFPGTGYQFLQDFLSREVGYLDFPALKLPEGKLSEASNLIARIALSQEARANIQRHGIEVPINHNLGHFASARHTKNRGRLRRALLNFYEEAKTGDLVVLPESLVSNQVWIGRFKSNKNIETKFVPRYGNNFIPAREIHWIGRHKENSVSSKLSEKLRQTHPFTLLEKSLYPEVFALAFGSFSYGGLMAATVYNSEGFLDTDAAFLGNVSRLASAACAALARDEEGIGVGGLLKAILSPSELSYTCTQEADIHSPGFIRYIGITAVPFVIAGLAAALIILAQGSQPASLEADVKALHFINSASNANPHVTALVSEASQRVFQSLGIDNTWALCEAAKGAHDRAGLRPSATSKR